MIAIRSRHGVEIDGGRLSECGLTTYTEIGLLPLADGTVADIDVQFVALDGPDAEADLRGFEGAGIWFNELREIPKGVITFGRGRVG